MRFKRKVVVRNQDSRQIPVPVVHVKTRIDEFLTPEGWNKLHTLVKRQLLKAKTDSERKVVLRTLFEMMAAPDVVPVPQQQISGERLSLPSLSPARCVTIRLE